MEQPGRSPIYPPYNGPDGSGQVVSEGLWWIERCPGDRSVNALTSQRLSDKGRGSTFYNVRVNVRKAQQVVPSLGQHKTADKITSDK